MWPLDATNGGIGSDNLAGGARAWVTPNRYPHATMHLQGLGDDVG